MNIKIGHKNWLKNLKNSIINPNVGLVGCTASFGSPKNLLFPKFLLSLYEILLFPLRVIHRSVKYLIYFDFKYPPNPHLRTNAFIIKKKHFQNYFKRVQIPIKKKDALNIESGRFSLTNFIFDLGLEVIVVGKNGKSYKKNLWYESKTFYCCDQQNLMVSDNQTRHFYQLCLRSKLRVTYDTWQRK